MRDLGQAAQGVMSLDTETRKHEKSLPVEADMKNLTITLPDELAADVRVRAAKAGKSMSKYVADKLKDAEQDRVPSQRAALEMFLSGPLMDLTDQDGKAPSRDQLID
jgi:plasmid stability protein